ncbi:MAG: Uma2 family endonuclease [Catenulispora sp.]|nr:Uma2 family endonuclease [Catenulispora sp.]
MTAAPLPDWLTPPEEGYTAEDLDRIPDLPPHTELIDGSLVFVSPQSMFHMVVIDRLLAALKSQAPDGLVVIREMTMTLAPRQRPEPDLSIVTEAAIRSLRQTDLPVQEALLVVEVVSPSSEVFDRERKPQLYAAAGIPNYWRIEDEGGTVVIHAYALAPDATYKLDAVHRRQLETDRPFQISIDLSSLTDLFGTDW